MDSAIGGVIRNLSEEGVGIQAVGPLRLGQQLALHFELLNPRLRADACGCVIWTNPQGQAGVEFLDVPTVLRRRLKEWIFDQLLATAELAGLESIFVDSTIPSESQELTFSENARTPIVLDAAHPVPELTAAKLIGIEPGRLELPNQSPAQLASREVFPRRGTVAPWWLVDGLILVCAVLLFLVIALGMTNTVPAWPIALTLMLAVTGVLAWVYWFLFLFWMGATPGEHLARLAGNEVVDCGPDGSEEDRSRFR